MPSNKSNTRAPLTFDLSENLLDKVEAYRRKSGMASNSEVIRSAIQGYDFSGYQSEEKAHRQISVRIDAKQKNELLRISRRKKASVGELLRAALEHLSNQPVPAGGVKTKKKGKMVKKQAKKKATKAAKKKVVKRGGSAAKRATKARKKTVKKATKKAVARKAASKKKTARKAVKKTTARKKAASKKKVAGKKVAGKKAAAKKKTAKKKTARRRR